MSKKESKPASRKTDIVVQEYNNEILIYDLSIHKAFILNKTSALVWQACDGSKTVPEIANQISRQLKSPVTEDLVWMALDGLKKENLIENNFELTPPFGGLTRREVIRRVGFASMVTLPVIAPLVAPTAAMAQSGGVCATGNCRCPNGSTSCNGSTATVGGVSYINCRTLSGGLTNCNCIGPFNAPNSAGAGFQSSQVGCYFS